MNPRGTFAMKLENAPRFIIVCLGPKILAAGETLPAFDRTHRRFTDIASMLSLVNASSCAAMRSALLICSRSAPASLTLPRKESGLVWPGAHWMLGSFKYSPLPLGIVREALP